MRHLADLLAPIPLPAVEADPRPGAGAIPGCDTDLVETLGAGLPAGHLHVWGGPSGVGKTSFLLCLLYGAAQHGRRVAYATYDLPASTLGLRMLAMTAAVAPNDLADGRLGPEAARRAAGARAALSRLPFWILESRGMGAPSLHDRLVRMPFRAEVLAIDYLQAVVRAPGTDLGQALRDLSAMAGQLHVAVVCAMRAGEDGVRDAAAVDAALRGGSERADRVGWIAPAAGSDARRAEVLRNRYGERPAVPLRVDPTTGRLESV
jgi:replicative DNA helicase